MKIQKFGSVEIVTFHNVIIVRTSTHIMVGTMRDTISTIKKESK